MVKILYVHFGDQWIRGSERVLLDLLSRVTARGVAPVLWTNGVPLADSLATTPVPVLRDRFSFYFDQGAPDFSPRRYAASVNRGIDAVRAHGIDLIHCNSAAPLQWCLPVAWRTGVPILVHLHAPYLRRSRLVAGIALADRIVGVSAAILADCRRDGIADGRLQVIHNGVAPERLTASPPIDLRARLGLAPDRVIMAIIGSLVRRKGHDVLFAAFDRLSEKFPQLHLVVVGGGPDETTLRAAASSPRIHFLGETDQVGGILQGGIDCLIVPSRREAAGLVIAEAGLFRIPSIGSQIDGIPEMIVDGETGLLVPVEDPARLAEAMARLIEDVALRRRFGLAAERLFQRRFHADRMAAAFEACYLDMLDSGAGGARALPRRLWDARHLWTG